MALGFYKDDSSDTHRTELFRPVALSYFYDKVVGRSRNFQLLFSVMSDQVATTTVRFPILEKSLSAEFRADFPNYSVGLVRGEPGGFVLTKDYGDNAEKFMNFPMRPEDVWVVTFPKCGNFSVPFL